MIRSGKTKSLVAAIVPALLLAASGARAADGFEAVRCGSDIPRALIGKKTNNEPVVKTEARHTDLRLKDLGADEINDDLNSISWSICGKEYVVLEDSHDVVRDAILFPAHSRSEPEFSGMDCRANGETVPGVIIAVLQDNPAAAQKKPGETLLPAKAAWKIDEKRKAFVPLVAAGLLCPRSGIVTADGGR